MSLKSVSCVISSVKIFYYFKEMKLTLFFICLLTSTALFAQNNNNDYKIYDVKRQKIISVDHIISDMDKSDILFTAKTIMTLLHITLKQSCSEN